MSKTIAFIGLGIMGLPMAKNLVSAGFTVRGFNRTPAKAEALAEAGGQAAATIAEAVDGADVIITMVPDSPDVENVLLGDEGILASAAAGATWIDFSTIRPDVATDLAEQAKEKGLKPLDAPVSGGEQGAIDAVLSIMLAGENSVFAAVGNGRVLRARSAAGQTVMAAAQLIRAEHVCLPAEAVVSREAYGVETTSALQGRGGGLAGSKVLDLEGQKMLFRSFYPGF